MAIGFPKRKYLEEDDFESAADSFDAIGFGSKDMSYFPLGQDAPKPKHKKKKKKKRQRCPHCGKRI